MMSIGETRMHDWGGLRVSPGEKSVPSSPFPVHEATGNSSETPSVFPPEDSGSFGDRTDHSPSVTFKGVGETLHFDRGQDDAGVQLDPVQATVSSPPVPDSLPLTSISSTTRAPTAPARLPRISSPPFIIPAALKAYAEHTTQSSQPRPFRRHSDYVDDRHGSQPGSSVPCRPDLGHQHVLATRRALSAGPCLQLSTCSLPASLAPTPAPTLTPNPGGGADARACGATSSIVNPPFWTTCWTKTTSSSSCVAELDLLAEVAALHVTAPPPDPDQMRGRLRSSDATATSSPIPQFALHTPELVPSTSTTRSIMSSTSPRSPRAPTNVVGGQSAAPIKLRGPSGPRMGPVHGPALCRVTSRESSSGSNDADGPTPDFDASGVCGSPNRNGTVVFRAARPVYASLVERVNLGRAYGNSNHHWLLSPDLSRSVSSLSSARSAFTQLSTNRSDSKWSSPSSFSSTPRGLASSPGGVSPLSTPLRSSSFSAFSPASDSMQPPP